MVANIVVIGCPSNASASWQPPVRPSVFRQQYLPPKPLGGISPIFTGLIGPLSELIKNFHFIKKYGCHGNQKETLKSCQKLLVRFQNNSVQMVLGTPSTKIVQIILIGLKYDHQVAWAVFRMSILGKLYFFHLKSQGLVRETTLLV